MRNSLYRRIAKECEDLRTAIDACECEKRAAVEGLSLSVSEFSKKYEEFRDREAAWAEEKEHLKGKLLLIETKADQLQSEVEAGKAETTLLKAQLRALEGQQKEITGLKLRLTQAEEREKMIQTKLQSTVFELDEHRDDYDHRISQMLTDRKRINELLGQKECQIEAKSTEITELNRANIDLQNRITTLEQLCCGKEDLHILIERLTKESELHQTTNDFLSNELHRLLEYLIGVSQGKLEAHRSIQALSDQLSAKDIEIDSLRQQLSKLKKKGPAYVPVKDDAVDSALADYVNNREEPLLVPFKREQPEIYSFGTKRTHVKLENCRLAVRVGGGYKLLDEFIEEYTPVELAKREKMFNRTASVEDRRLARSATEIQTGPDDPKRKTASPTKGRK